MHRLAGCSGSSGAWTRAAREDGSFSYRNAVIIGMALFHASPAQMAGIHAALVEGLCNGSLRPVVGQEFPLGEAPRAHEAVMAAGHHGKIVLVP